MSKEFPRIFHVEHIIDTFRLLELGTVLLVAAARSDFGCCVGKKAGGNTATMQMTTVDNGEISDVNSHRIWRPWKKVSASPTAGTDFRKFNNVYQIFFSLGDIPLGAAGGQSRLRFLFWGTVMSYRCRDNRV